MDFSLQIAHPLAKIFTEVKQRFRIDPHALALHGGYDRNQRPLHRFVKGCHTVLDKARLQKAVQPQGDIRILRCVVTRRLQGYIVERHLVFSSSGNVFETDAVVVEMQFR